ncbi:MAG: AI-2E family transporter [Thiobacillus sp.]|jgi:predicted PurR-regulated permease PerM|uniref:AI-2E family transporter n=1 Tax=Thiobacillus sp. TaxID=924 RepID=UPI0028939D45|nr:AI-2E family transporter [Thiobacillus sp.]MDT3705882.1 AI-2E family transporter [Thiobacillus sp.]
MPIKIDSPLARRVAAFAFLFLIFGLSLWVLSPFLASLAWSGILAYVTWPLYQWLRRRLPGRDSLAAVLMTLGVAAMLLLPLVWVLLTLVDDIAVASASFRRLSEHGLPPLPPGVHAWPGGEWLAAQYERVQADPQWLRAQIAALELTDASRLGNVAGDVGRNVAKFGLAVFALFFLYRDGENALTQFRGVATRWLGGVARSYIQAVGVTVRAVVFGIVLTALAQGVLAGLGYWAAGIAAPVLWGMITALVSLIPFVGPVVWIGLSLGLLAQGETQAALGLFLWGALVVSWVDNLIRPLVISGPTRIPFLLVFLGVLGGLNAFGLIGLFLGPVLLAVAMAIWREWLVHARPG